MIVPMAMVHIAAAGADRRKLLEALAALGLVHLQPVDPKTAVADEAAVAAMDRIGRAMQVLAEYPPAGGPVELAPLAAAEEVLTIQRESVERHNRLASLHRQMDQLVMWGELRLGQLGQLQAAGVALRFYSVPAADLDKIQAECVQVLARQPGRVLLVAVAGRGEPTVPASARELPPPTTDRPSIRAEAAAIDAALRRDAERLAELAAMIPKMRAELRALRRRVSFTVAGRSGLGDEHLFALQGWLPAEQVEQLPGQLEQMGVFAAVQAVEPAPGEQPPTLLRVPRWARPAEALLRALGVVPGYHERDVAPAFMIALPVFVAMIIGDAGYGLLFLLLPAVFYRKLVSRTSADLVHLMMVFGAAATAWGAIAGSYFGIGPDDMKAAGGIWAQIGTVLEYPRLLTVEVSDKSQGILMRICFLLAAVHLSAAHLWRALGRFPNIRFLSSLGWAIALWGVYGLVKTLVLNDPFYGMAYPYLMLAGGALAVGFATPRKYVIDGLLLGAVSSFFPAIGTLSDTLSYVRLMAICLASSVLAVSFNNLAVSTGSIVAAIPILVVGHLLNIALTLVAILAHGVRLNLLEFSNNLGMEWSGYPYQPFKEGPAAVDRAGDPDTRQES
jgi:V/A-type H+-transporting ATPase subunit I